MGNKTQDYNKKKEFRTWLKDDPSRWSDDSVNSYVSGIGGLIKWFNANKSNWNQDLEEFDNYLKRINNQKDRDTFFSAILNILQKEIKNKPDNKSTLQNYKSYLNAFEEFFRSEPFTINGLTQQQIKVLRKYGSTITYTKEELIKEFKQRILTQDRISMSKTVMFPIRLIKKLWSTETDDWAKDVCKNIYLIVKSGEETKKIQLKDIKELRINDGENVTIKGTNEEEYGLYTFYSDPHESLFVDSNRIEYNNKNGECGLQCEYQTPFSVDKNHNIKNEKNEIILWHVKQMKIKTLSDIAIDHDIPISLILKENEKDLKKLKRLSDKYKKLSAQYGLKVSAKEVNKFCKKIKENSIKEVLKKTCNGNFPIGDMEIIGKCKLVLMAKDENTMKSDS